MGLLRRLQRIRPSDEQPDDEFPYFTVGEAARFRSYVRSAFADSGVEVSVYAGHVEAIDGTHYGLTNLAANCHAAGRERAWRKIIERHIQTILRLAATDAFADVTDSDLQKHTFIRLMSTVTLLSLDGFSYRRDLGGELVELLALDGEDSVAIFRDEDVEVHGLEKLRGYGLRNLLAEPFGTYEWITVHGDAGFVVVIGASVYTASRMLTLSDVLRRTTGEVDLPYGLLVCAPYRHQLAFHVLSDTSVIHVLPAMARFAALGYSDGVGPLTPYVYWWHNGTLRQVSERHGEDGMRIVLEGEFGELFERLASGSREDA